MKIQHLTEAGIARALQAAIEAGHLTHDEVDKFSTVLSDAAMSLGIDAEEGGPGSRLMAERADRLDTLAVAFDTAAAATRKL